MPRHPEHGVLQRVVREYLETFHAEARHRGGLLEARGFCQMFFPWYNAAHHHSGLGLPERFVRGVPYPPTVPGAVWINPPAPRPSDAGDIDPQSAPAQH